MRHTIVQAVLLSSAGEYICVLMPPSELDISKCTVWKGAIDEPMSPLEVTEAIDHRGAPGTKIVASGKALTYSVLDPEYGGYECCWGETPLRMLAPMACRVDTSGDTPIIRTTA